MTARMKRRRRRGEGSVYESQGSWIASYPLGSVNGKRKTRRARCATERAALGELERMRRSYGAGGDPATGTLGEYLTGWLASWRRVRKSTLTSYDGHVRLHISPLLGGIPLAKVQPSDVRRLVTYLEGKGLAPATIVRVVTTLRIALGAAVRDRSLAHNAADIRELPRVEREPVRPLIRAEADAILTAVDGTWVGPIARLLLGSGMRLGEAIGLDQRDLLLDEGFVRIRRTKTDVRAIPISDDAVLGLREALGRLNALARTSRSSTPHAARGRGCWDRACPMLCPRSCARPASPNSRPMPCAMALRPLMLADGHQMRVIAEQLGHRNPALTAKVYAHVIPQSLRAAVGSLERTPAGTARMRRAEEVAVQPTPELVASPSSSKFR